MNGYHVGLGCPRCGDELEHLASSKPWRSDQQRSIWYAAASAVARCPKGHGTWQVSVTLTPCRNEREAEQKRRERR